MDEGHKGEVAENGEAKELGKDQGAARWGVGNYVIVVKGEREFFKL